MSTFINVNILFVTCSILVPNVLFVALIHKWISSVIQSLYILLLNLMFKHFMIPILIFIFTLFFSEHRRPCGLCNHRAHSTGYIPDGVCACLHWVCLQEAFACFFLGHLGLLGCNGLPFYVFWWNRVSMGSGKKWLFMNGFVNVTINKEC